MLGLEEAKKLSIDLLKIKSDLVDAFFEGVKQPYNKIRVRFFS